MEDNDDDYCSLLNNLQKFFKQVDIKYCLFRAKTKQELFHYVFESDIVFLDVELQGENGIDLGIKIREKNEEIKIIFVTNYIQYSIDGYKAQANRYFLKPISQKHFNSEFSTLIKKYMLDRSGFIDLKLDSNKIYYKNVLYIEYISSERKTVLHLITGKNLKTNYPLKYWLNELKSLSFCQSYKSILVNLNCVSATLKNNIILINDESIPLSRSYKKSFDEANLRNLHKRI